MKNFFIKKWSDLFIYLSKTVREWFENGSRMVLQMCAAWAMLRGKCVKCLKSLMQIFATFVTYASAIFVGKESCKSTVRYALWSGISLIKPLQNPYLTLARFRLSLGSNLSRFSLASLIFLCMQTVGVGDAWGTTSSVSISTYATSNSWSDGTRYYSVTIDGNVTATASNGGEYNGTYNSANTQWRFYQNGSGTLTITTTSGTLSSVTLTFNTKDKGTLSYGGSGVTSGSAVSVSGTSATFTVGASSGTKGKIFITDISVTYGSSCSNSVTINKGTETNCTFTLSKSGSQASCDGVSTTVTVTPNTGYGTPVVTQSGASATPTITGSGTSWTVTYPANTTGTSVINVSCSAKTTTVSFNQNGGSGGQTTSKTATYGQAMPTPITTPTRTGYTFGGYYDGSGGTGNKYYNADGSSAANWNKDAATATLYAKWTAKSFSVTWMVNGEEYTAGGSTSVNYGSHVATLPTAPTPPCGNKFMGWTTTNIGSVGQATDAGLNLFTTAGGAPIISAEGPVTYYAVFADYAE